MTSQLHNLENRINTLNSMLIAKHDRRQFNDALRVANGDLQAAIASLQGKLPEASLRKIALVQSLADWSDDHVTVVKSIAAQPGIESLRDVALQFNAEKLTELIDPHAIPADTAGVKADDKTKNFSIFLQNRLFAIQPTAVLQRMVAHAEVPIKDSTVRSGVVTFLNSQPDFNIRTSSVLHAFKRPNAFDGIEEQHRPAVMEQLKTLQRVQAIAHTPDAIPTLMKANLNSAYLVGEMPESAFVRTVAHELDEATARTIHANAMNIRIRNEHVLMKLHESVRGTGIGIIDGNVTREQRLEMARQAAKDANIPVNLETLFGNVDYCECEDCLSVYSPAAYFVELLQYLRNNNLDSNPNDPSQKPKTDPKDITGTPLEMLFRRRPDLGCLELTCENTFTVLPYIDLVNEVLESFIVHEGEYEANTLVPKQATLEAFNVEDETTGELLAEPQHINDKAYCILKDQVYPFTLPYHQPIDAIRIFLEYLGSSRYELLDTFRSANDACADPTLTPELLSELKALHAAALDRAVDAESLGLTEEEYVILTHEQFWTKRYFEIIQKKTLTDDEYATIAHVKSVNEYYGLKPTDDLAANLTMVKSEFLPRTGLKYVELVEMLKTRFINPNYPHGEALAYMQSIRASYRYLHSLLKDSTDPNVRYGDLIAVLQQGSVAWPLIEARLHPNPCKPQPVDKCSVHADIRKWVLCNFEKIGNLIVLESGDGPQLSIEGELFTFGRESQLIGRLLRDGRIVGLDGETLEGNVKFPGTQVYGKDGVTTYFTQVGNFVWVKDPNGKTLGFIDDNGLMVGDNHPASWRPTPDSCDLSKVRLIHLDGTALNADDYDRIQRFIRLWRKLGWTIDEVDQAIVGLAPKANPCQTVACGCDQTDDCGSEATGGSCCCDSAAARVPKTITPDLLHLLSAVNKLLVRTGLELPRLLAFWDHISTRGIKPLYDRLFLTHNLVSIDPIFKPDGNGNVLTPASKMSEHVPILLAALHLKPSELDSVVTSVPLTDSLSLENVSAIYRRTALSKLLGIRITELPKLVALIGDPFASPASTLALLDFWERVENSGFNLSQMDFLVARFDAAVATGPVSPLTPSPKSVLQLSKTLYDGLIAIDKEHPDVEKEVSLELVRSSIGLVFEPPVVEQIVSLLEGTTVYTTNAPAGLTITIPPTIGLTADIETLSTRLKYATLGSGTTATGSIQVVGILTDAEMARAKALSANPDWTKALDRIAKQRRNVFNDYLSTYFDDVSAAQLLGGDIAATESIDGSAPSKSLVLMTAFIPKLRQLLARRLIVGSLAATVGISKEVTEVLLADILTIGVSKTSALSLLQTIHDKPTSSTGTGWTGFLIPPVDGEFIFTAISDLQPAPIVIDGSVVPFTVQQEDPSNVWSTDPNASTGPIKLFAGKLYSFTVSDRKATEISWRSATTPMSMIPTAALLPDQSTPGITEVLVKLKQSSLVVKGFSLTVDEIRYWQNRSGFNFNEVTRSFWERVQSYAELRDSLPRKPKTLLDLFAWATKPDDPLKLASQIADVTDWPVTTVAKLIVKDHLDLDYPDPFCDEIQLVRLRTAIEVANRIGMEIDLLFEWAKPTSRFKTCRKIADSIRAAIRSRYSAEDYEQAVKPLRDRLRRNQRDALVAYLLVQPALIDWGVVDADSLFEFFLIDTQMDCCLQTSRMKQAISTVQSYVQRCMLGLEEAPEKSGIGPGVLDRGRWKSLSREVIRTANRKVFVNTENYLVASLRDDKSLFYKDLESELLQRDLSPKVISDVLTSYVYKVSDVANLKVVGLHAEEGLVNGREPFILRLHIFGRSRNAPYFYYYRTYDMEANLWTPWSKVDVDIPNFDVHENEVIKDSGTYLLPMIYRNRLLIFFPQIVKKTASPSTAGPTGIPSDTRGGFTVTPPKIEQYWDVSMAWSEYRNGKWTPKQLSRGGKRIEMSNLPDASSFQFSIRNDSGSFASNEVIVSVWDQEGQPQLGFRFNGSLLYPNLPMLPPMLKKPTSFDFFSNAFYSTQVSNVYSPATVLNTPHFKTQDSSVTFATDAGSTLFSHLKIADVLHQLNAKGIDGCFEQLASFGGDENIYGQAPPNGSFNELSMPNAIYNWELGFHAPMAMVDRLLKSQQYEDALRICHYIFNPLAQGTSPNRCWLFPPFQEVKTDTTMTDLFSSLKPNTPDRDITEWRNQPFQPHMIARRRPAVYMKWVVMKYIEILIAMGDQYFRQNSLETVPLAIQCYVLASHLYGPRGQLIPKRGKTKPETYRSLLSKWDAFDNALVDLELAAPFSNQTSNPLESINGTSSLPNIFGFATSLYFCVPNNPKLRELRDTIDDRLFKIRHCQDIDGVVRQLPLFDPPIDPMLLVQAAAAGLSLSSVVDDVNGPMPNYRFYYLLQKAMELCSELKSLGAAFLSAKEKHDAETLSRLRAGHELVIHGLVMEVRKQQLEEANRSIEALQQSRKAPEYRMQYFLQLLGDKQTKLPTATSGFTGVPVSIEAPVDREGGLKLLSSEKEEMDKSDQAAEIQEDIGNIETLASILHLIPSLNVAAKPFGVGVESAVMAGTFLGNASQAVAKGISVKVGNRNRSSSSAGRTASHIRALYDRVHQASNAGFEIVNIDKQILTQNVRQAIASQEINNQQKQIDNAQEVDDFLRNKYSNAELYTWMEGSIQELYRQAFSLAYDLAKRAEKVFRFERGISTSNYIQPEYWDNAYDGLLAGERLHLGLKQLEAAYQEKRGYDFEVTRHISLRQIDPLALMQLRSTGECEFELPEIVFDMDYPGHYQRRIKSVALSVPCVVGPYTSLNATLRLLQHKFRTTARASNKSDYPEHVNPSDDRFSTVNVPISSIAASTGQNDSGVFELNFRDERYIPFEGAGAVSRWRLKLPQKFRQFDYSSMADVILHMRYTSLDGGDKLRGVAQDYVQDFVTGNIELSRREGLFTLFDLRSDFPNEWGRLTQGTSKAQKTITLAQLSDRLPFFTKGTARSKIVANGIYLFWQGSVETIKPPSLQKGTSEPIVFGPANIVSLDKNSKTFKLPDDSNVSFEDDWKMIFDSVPGTSNSLWLVVRYSLEN